MNAPLAIEDPYLLLGVPRDADDETLKGAYRRRARELHPDVCHEPDTERRFAEVTHAYRTLTDPDQRQRIDADIDALAGFLSTRPGPVAAVEAGEQLTVPLRLSPAQAGAGGVHTLSVDVRRACASCLGDEPAPGRQRVPCADCDGTGHRAHVQHTLSGDHRTWRPCLTCEGRGTRPAEACGDCDGEGRRLTTALLTVRLPAGLEDRARLVLRGQGHAGRNGGAPGDLGFELIVTELLSCAS